MALSAKALDEQYGPELSRPPLADCTSAYYLHQALVAKGIQVTHEACKLWWRKYRVVPGQVSIASAKELEEQHGSASATWASSMIQLSNYAGRFDSWIHHCMCQIRSQ